MQPRGCCSKTLGHAATIRACKTCKHLHQQANRLKSFGGCHMFAIAMKNLRERLVVDAFSMMLSFRAELVTELSEFI